MAGDDTTADPLSKKDPTSTTEQTRKEEEEPAPDGGDPGGSVSNASSVSSSPPAASSIGKLTGGAMENNAAVVAVAASSKEKAATDFFPDKAHVTDALRSTLADLGASDVTFVYEKQHMPPSDRNKGQNRLLMSCKCESKRAAFARILTETEMPLVHQPLKTEDEEEHDDNDGDDECSGVGNKEGTDKDGAQQGKQKRKVQGLDVQAYDCDGTEYELNLRYLTSNNAYRIIGPGYSVFLKNNGLLIGGGGVSVTTTTGKRSAAGRRQKKRRSSLPNAEPEPPTNEQPPPAARDADDDIHMELWSFRSPKLTIGVKDQPEGKLGLLLLHSRRGGEAGAGAVEEEVQVAAAHQDQEVVEQPEQNSHGGMAMAAQDEDIMGAARPAPLPRELAAGDSAATVVVVDEDGAAAAGNKVGDAAPRSRRRDMLPLSPVELVIAGWLSFRAYDAGVNDGDNGDDAADGSDNNCTSKQGPS